MFLYIACSGGDFFSRPLIEMPNLRNFVMTYLNPSIQNGSFNDRRGAKIFS
jgi:hypothetical protein